MNLQDFLKSVAKLPKAGSDFNSNWGEILDKDAAGWQAVVQDSANWDDLARQTKPRKAGAELMMAIVNLVGLDMANHFISSGNNDAKGNAKSWFLNNLSQYAKFSAKGKESIDADDLISNPGQVWKHLGKNKRTDLIDYA